VSGETKEVGTFCWLKLENACDCGQNLARYSNIPPLFEPGVPGDAYTSEFGDFLPAQSRRSPTPTVREA
jgi:hypothetical protein